jgi:hypothetical protein
MGKHDTQIIAGVWHYLELVLLLAGMRDVESCTGVWLGRTLHMCPLPPAGANAVSVLKQVQQPATINQDVRWVTQHINIGQIRL